MINKRLSSISYNETEFNKCKKEYEDALLDSEFNCKLSFETPKSTKKKRKIIYGSIHLGASLLILR